MELIDEIQRLAKVFRERSSMISTEEATKSALIMPFIAALGYDVFDPFEVVPEFTADVGLKKGEKVDYAIVKDGTPVMLIEAKWCGEALDVTKEGQLLRYFHTTPAAVGILTNGCEYRFYTDLDQENIMDTKPFLQFSINDVNEQIVRELKKFTKSAFNMDEITSTASELKYTGEMKRYLIEQLAEPCDEFVEHLTRKVFEGKLTEKVREKFKAISKKAFSQFVSDRVSDRLASALSEEKASSAQKNDTDVPAETANDNLNKIITTQEEIDAYNIVKSILRKNVELNRIVMRDTQSYCGILLDDSNRKPICRFYFNTSNKYLATFDNEKKEKKILLSSLDDIYMHTDALMTTVNAYLSPVIQPTLPASSEQINTASQA